MSNPNRVVLVDYAGKISNNFNLIAAATGYQGYTRIVNSQTPVRDAVGSVLRFQPSVVLINPHWNPNSPDGKGLEAIAAIRAQNASPIIYSVSEDIQANQAAITRVAAGSLNMEIETLIEVLYRHKLSPEVYAYGKETMVGKRALAVLKEMADDYVRIHTIDGRFVGDPAILVNLATINKLLFESPQS